MRAKGRFQQHRRLAGADILIINGRGIAKGIGSGKIVISEAPISFLGGVDTATGSLTDKTMKGISIKDRVFAFPRGKGSTVGSYTMLELKRQGTLPAAIINSAAEPIVATGAVMCGVPMVDRIDLSLLRNGDTCIVNGEKGTVELPDVTESKVVSCAILEDEEILVLKRSEKVGTFQGHWADVSGFIEEGETPVQTAFKEVCEEVGLSSPELMKDGGVIRVRDADKVWSIHPFLFRAPDRKITIDWEHTEYRWVRPSAISELKTVPGLDRVLRHLGLQV